jgi:hypothetical protein
MINIEAQISQEVLKAIQHIYNIEINSSIIQVQKTRKEFDGDYTLTS